MNSTLRTISSFRVKAVLLETWELLRTEFKPLFLCALVFCGVGEVVDILVQAAGESIELTLGVAFSAILSTWYEGTVAKYLFLPKEERGSIRSIRSAFLSLDCLFTLAVVGVLAGVALFLGMIALVIPAALVLTWWSVIAPVVVVERKSVFATFRRSHQLVRGHDWRVFAVMMIASFIVCSIVIGLIPLDQMSSPGNWLLRIVIWIVSALIYPAAAVGVTVIYIHLIRVEQEKGLTQKRRSRFRSPITYSRPANTIASNTAKH